MPTPETVGGIKPLHYGDNDKSAGLIDGDYDGRNDNFNPDEPFATDVPTIEEKAASTLDVIGASADIYYADAGQDVYITVRLSNPDSYEIMSFTLNGKKYSSYMFEDSSDMESLVLKVDKNSLSGGINEYTIDAIKYIDGTDIKDVRIDGDRTVKVGVRVGDDMTYAVVTNEQISLTSVQFDVTIADNYNLIARNNGYVEAVLYDGLKMIYKDIAIDGTTTHVEFDNLLPNTLVLPNTVTRIDSEAFYWASLRGLVLNEGLIYIGGNGINILGGMYVYLPSTVKTCNNPGTTVFVSSENKNGIKGSKASRHTVRLHNGETTTTLTGEYVVLPDQIQSGKRLLGWKDSNGNFVQKIYCPTADVDLYAELIDITESDGITPTTPLRIQDGAESVKVRLFGLDKLYFIIDTHVEGDYVVSMKVHYSSTNVSVSVPIYSIYNDSSITVTETDKAFRYIPQTVLSLCPFRSGYVAMKYPFEVELTVTAV